MQQPLQNTQYSIELEGRLLPIVIRKHKRARRMIIRYQPLNFSLSLTLPRYVSVRQGLSFIEEKRNWIARELAAHQVRIAFTHGSEIPVLGTTYTLVHVGGRGVVTRDGNTICVPGEAVFMPRRVRDWLKQEAREQISMLAGHKAGLIGREIKKIGLRDTISRWGSCNHKGHLSFSWRLILAPREVLDYVVAHEVAHLVYLNHSPAFWKVVARLCPDYHKHQHWLKCHGAGLLNYG